MLKRSIQIFTIVGLSIGLLGEVISSAIAEDTIPSNITTSTTVEAAGATSSASGAGDKGEGEKTERVQVTGSHIKRLAVEGASPVQTVTQKEIEKSGYNSVSDVLRDTTANSFGSTREDSGSNAAGAAHVDLRGLGATNTLVLMNGQRLPTDAVTGAVDLNLIPVAAVERVEVLKDGASAIYGSDALGGVVNIITKKDFAGTEASLSRTMTDSKGGSRLDVGLVNGVNKENLNVVTVLQYRDNDAVYDRDRPWSKTVQSLIGGPGSYRNASGSWMADSSCPADKLVTTPQGTFCSFNPADFMTALPQLNQASLLSEAHYQLGSSVKLTARAGGTRRLVKWSYAAAPGTFTIPGAVADHLGPGGTPLPGATPGQDLSVRYRLTELGTRDTEITTYGYNLFLGGDVSLANDWNLGLNVAHNAVNSSDKGVNGYALTGALTNAIQSGAYNPFGTSGQKGSLEGTRYVPVEDTKSLLTSSEIKASGPIAEIGGSTISMAVGSTVTHQLYKDTFDEKSVNGEVFGNAGSSGGGQRATQALFTELSIPMFDSKAELQLAGRYDHYSDFGSTTNPKAALLIRPTSQLLIRGSVGTGFKAPLMQDLYASTSMGYPSFIDNVACDAEKKAGGSTPSCQPQQYQVTSGGNTGLKEEKSLSYNVGAVFEPHRNFNIGADFFAAKLSNVVGISYSDATLAESQGINLASHGVIIKRDSQGYIEEVIAPLQNLSAQQISGLDISSALRVGKFKLAAEHSLMFHFMEEGFPGTGMRNKLDENGRPRWRQTTSLSFSPSERQDLSLIALTTAGQKKTVEEQGRIPTYTQLDLSYGYQFKKIGTLSLGVKNILGTTPPLDDSNPSSQLNTSLYDQIGRQFVMRYSKMF